ncbi:MAG: beta-propeller domain-containing protein [Firmicutes bacterium]|nr:beta-propeller domain-containing protein [Bacillota bacterium]
MSKLNDYFDQIEVNDDLKHKTANQIRQAKVNEGQGAKNTFPWYKRSRVWIRASACVLILAIALPLLLSLPLSNNIHIPSVVPPIAGASHAFAIQDQEHLNSLFNIIDTVPSRNNSNGWHFGCTSSSAPDSDNNLFGQGGGDNAGDSTVNAPPSNSGDRENNSGPTSETNIQVDGMDEGDIVRNDGNYIYRLSPQGVTIVRTNRGQIDHVITMQYQNFAPVEMIVNDNIMIILGGTRSEAPYWLLSNMSHSDWQWFSRWHDRVQIRVYDITDRSQPILTRFLEIDGRFNTSRVRIETNTLFFVVDFTSVVWNWCSRTQRSYRHVMLPYFRECVESELKRFSFQNLFYTVRDKRMHSFMLLGRIDLENAGEPANIKGYLSASDIISVSRYNLYTATTVWGREGRQWVDRTHISRFCLETLNFTGTAMVLGTPPSRHAIDEHNGYLRVAATYGAWWMSWNEDVYFASAVFVFDKNLKLVSYITNIAQGETMDSARFNGDFGFISTSPPWLIWDPLYTIDLRDHNNISISEGLETDGINQYLRHVPGTSFAIGIGQDASPEGAAWQTGIKIELYDMRIGTGEMPISLSKYTIYGDWTGAEILWDSRALLFFFCEDTLIGYVGFSAVAAGMRNAWNNVTFAQGFYLWRIDGVNGRLEFLGESRRERLARHNAPTPGSSWVWQYVYVDLLLPSFSNFDTSMDIAVNWQNWAEIMSKYIYRAVLNQGYLFTVSDSMIIGYCLNTRQRVGYFKETIK